MNEEINPPVMPKRLAEKRSIKNIPDIKLTGEKSKTMTKSQIEEKELEAKKELKSVVESKNSSDGAGKTNRIQEFFSKNEQGMGNELFRVDDTNTDIKTELNAEELRQVNTLYVNDKFLLEWGLKPVFGLYYNKFMRLMISFERKSRGEYVKINTRDRSDETLNLAGNIGSILSGQQISRR